MNEFEKSLLKYFSPDNLRKIQRAKVGVAGAGGLGSNCAAMLVRSGVKQLKIIDFDLLEYSNLNRQFYFSRQVGRAKVEALQENLQAINPDAVIEVYARKLEGGEAAAIFADCDAVVEAFDCVEYKKLIAEAYMHSGKLLVAASGLGGWGDSDRLKVHKVRPNFYIVGDLSSGVGPECPPLAPCVAIAAAKQADLVISHILGPMKGGAQDGTRSAGQQAVVSRYIRHNGC